MFPAKKKKRNKSKQKSKIIEIKSDSLNNFLFKEIDFFSIFKKILPPQKPAKRKRRKKKKSAPDFPFFQKINWEAVGYFSSLASLATLLAIIIFLLSQITALSLVAETHDHIGKLAYLNQKLEKQTDVLKKDLELLQDHTLNLNERKEIMEDLRELDEEALELRYEILAYENDLSVQLWLGSPSFLTDTFAKARTLELFANRLSRDLSYLTFMGRVNSFQLKLTQKDFDLLQEKIIFIKSRLEATGVF